MNSFRFVEQYPNLAEWVKNRGWIELGKDEWNMSMIRISDEGGMIWEGEFDYANIDDALSAAEHALTEWLKENG